MKTLIGTRTARTTLRKRYETKTETSHSVGWKDDGHRDGTVQIFVDLDRLAVLYGGKALTNKAGKARGMNGCVEVVLVRGTAKDHRLSEG